MLPDVAILWCNEGKIAQKDVPQYLICLALLMLNRAQRLHLMLLQHVSSPTPSSEAVAACRSYVQQEASSIRLEVLKDGLWRVDWPFWLADELEGDTLCGLTLQGCYTDCCDICPGHAARDGVALPWKQASSLVNSCSCKLYSRTQGFLNRGQAFSNLSNYEAHGECVRIA